MDKSVAGLLGAMGALAVASPSHATTNAGATLDSVMQVDSYADLLKPIPNALSLREAFAESQAATPAEPDLI